MDPFFNEALRQGAGFALAVVVFYYARKDAKENADRTRELAEQLAKNGDAARQALIDNTVTLRTLTTIVENSTKISESVLDRMSDRKGGRK